MHEEPVHKPGMSSGSNFIVYDAERCIVHALGIRVSADAKIRACCASRNKGEITVSPGRQLDHDYTLMDDVVCPVGALTSSDFRFKARWWFLFRQRAHGLPAAPPAGQRLPRLRSARINMAYRHRPRENMQVNKY